MASAKDNIIFGGSETSSVTGDYKCFAGYFLDRFKEHDEKIILINGVSGQKYSGRTIYNSIIRLAHCLQKLDIKEGDVVGICSENRYEFLVTLFASLCLNAAVAPLNVTYTERELDHAVNLSKPKVFFTSMVAAEKIVKVSRKNKFMKHLFIYSDASPFKELTTFAKLFDNPNIKSSLEFQPRPTNIFDNVSLIVCSSGTTGLPKGVQLTQKNIMSTVDRHYETNFVEGMTILSVIPWFHSFGCLSLILSTTFGSELVYLPKFDEHMFLNAIQSHKVNLAFMVPPLMVFLAKHPIVSKYDLSSIVGLLCGAAPLSKETEDAVKARIGVQIIRQGYGLSESTLSLLTQIDGYTKSGSVGALKTGHYAKVIDPDTGKALGPNLRGELCFKGDCIMKGYVGDTKSTESVIDKDGWLHTGDVGYYDEDFEFFIVDRIKELIKYKAFQVPPAEIESLLLTHPKIKDAAVVGLPDEESGELPFAFIVKQPNAKITEKDVINFVTEKASPAKRLRGGVQFLNEIPKNPSGKILRRLLREMLKTNKPKSKL